MNDKTFHPNWAALTLMFFALVFSAHLCSQLSTASATPWMVYSARFCVAGLPLILLIWLMSVRLTIAQEGIAYRSIFGSKSLTWREIQYIKTSSTRYLLNGMFPFAERTSFEITGGNLERKVTSQTVKKVGWFTFSHDSVERTGKQTRITFGWRLDDSQKAAKAIESNALPFLLLRANFAFDVNEEVSFGSIALSNQGIRCSFMDDLFGDSFGSFETNPNKPSRYVPWAAVKAYSIENGRFLVRFHDSTQINVPVSEVANLPVLIAMVDSRSLMTFQPATPKL